jgi:RHS repeat-associated protein
MSRPDPPSLTDPDFHLQLEVEAFAYSSVLPDGSGEPPAAIVFLHLDRARWMNPGWGRFTQLDPAGIADGLNRYAYVRNSPIGRVDPDGLKSRVRGFDRLPDRGQGYYTYAKSFNEDGDEDSGGERALYGRHELVTFIQNLAIKWQVLKLSLLWGGGPWPGGYVENHWLLGVGPMSTPWGGKFGDHGAEHGGHWDGRGVDFRPMRLDGKPDPVSWNGPNKGAYWLRGTSALVDLIWWEPLVDRIYFNDPRVPGAQPVPGDKGAHDNHIHVRLDKDWLDPLPCP